MGRSFDCRVCGFRLTAVMPAATVRERAEWARQIDNGVCDPCSRQRWTAAVEFERASYGVHLLISMGAGWDLTVRPPRPISVLARALGRLKAADHECVRLKMWPATERSTT